jgi:hypothetical protein
LITGPGILTNDSKTNSTVKKVLDTGTDALDSSTLARLRQVRREALQQSPDRDVRWWMPVSALGATAAAVLVATWLTTTVAPQANVEGIEDIEILASADNTDLYEQMDFYEWLESQQGNKQTNAG